MNQPHGRDERSPRHLLHLTLLLIGICALYGWATQSIRPLYDLSREESIPISINATKTADYSPDFYTPVGNIGLGIIRDLLQDLDPASAPNERMATLAGALRTPVASVTAPPGSTPLNVTAPATLPVETTLPESPVPIIPNTPIPSTSTPIPPSPPPPPPPPKPTKPPKEEPPTAIPPTSTPTATPEPVHLNILNPASDGTSITGNDSTTFEAEAWDPAVGTTNGDGITSITFTIYDSIGNTLHTYVDVTPSYCAFGGDSSCSDSTSAGIALPNDTYTLEVIMLTDTGETKTNTRTFVIPTVTHLDITLPPTDGTIFTNTADTKLEAEAWDSTVGINNGDGITSITFVLYDSLSNPIYTYVDSTPAYCAFGGDSACVPSTTAGVTLTTDTYTLETTVLTDAGGTSTVTRTFIIP
jgi:hypothetical protein